MAKLTLSPIGSFSQAAITTINQNMAGISTAVEKTLSRDGTTPNQMTADLDLNNNDLLNVKTTNTTNLFLNGQMVIGSPVSTTSAAGLLTLIKTVDGAGSGLDADLLDGLDSTAFQPIDSDLTAIAALTTTAYGRGLLTSASVGALSATWTNIQSGTGAVARTIQSKFAERVSVKDYGAVGNGSTDDTAAIQAAITFISLTGGTVFFPRGRYKVSSALSVTSGNILLQGEGLGASQLITNSATADIVVFGTGIVASVTRVAVRDIFFGTSVTRTAGHSINLNGVYIAEVTGCTVDHQFRGITVQGTSKLVFLERNYISEPVPTTGFGIYLTGNSNDIYMTNLFVIGTAGSQPNAGIFIDNANGVFGYNTGVFQGGAGLYISPGNSQLVENVFFTSSAFDSCSVSGVLIAPTGTGAARRIQFNGSWGSSNTQNGINISGAAGTTDDVQLVGFRSYANGQHGILVSGANAINIALNGCISAGNSSSSPGTYHGIAFGTGATKFQVLNCISSQVGGQGNTQGYGCAITDAASDNYLVENNNFKTNVTGSVLNSGTGATQYVKNNIGYVTQARGAASGTTDASGDLIVTHGMSVTPSVIVVAKNGAVTTGECQAHTFTSTTFKIRFWTSAGVTDASVSRAAMWTAYGPGALLG